MLNVTVIYSFSKIGIIIMGYFSVKSNQFSNIIINSLLYDFNKIQQNYVKNERIDKKPRKATN